MGRRPQRWRAATQVQVTTCCSPTESEEWTIWDTLERFLCFNATYHSTTDFVYIAVTKKIPNKDGKLISLDPTTFLIFIDIKKAHFWSPAWRRLLVEIPPGNGLSARHGGIAQEVSVWNSWRSRELGGGDQGCDASTWISSGEEQRLFVFPWRAKHSDRSAWRWFHWSRTEERIGMVRSRAQEVLDCGSTWNSRSTINGWRRAFNYNFE